MRPVLHFLLKHVTMCNDIVPVYTGVCLSGKKDMVITG